MSDHLDEATQIRPGEELPLDRLEAYLSAWLPDRDGPLTIEQFPSGHSNLTYLLHLGSQELVLRREPFENLVKSAHDMSREYRVLSKLSLAYPPAPRPLHFCDDPGVLGVPFYLMERRHGIILRSQVPSAIAINPPLARRLSESLIDNLARLHSLDVHAIGLGDLGKPEGYTTRQVSGWSDRWQKARTGELPVMDQVARWLTERVPEPAGAVLIHNDYKYDNLVLDPEDPGRIVAVLDWEMATVGCPLMDLGTTLGYWVEAGDPAPLKRSAMGPTALEGSLTRQELVERYGAKTGRDVSGILFHYVFGLFKIAVIVQQIYARYVRGHTRDPRFASLDRLVMVLAEQADRSIASGRI